MDRLGSKLHFEPRVVWTIGLIVFLLYVFCLITVPALLGREWDNQALYSDPDSNVRLAQIRAFVAGQDWFDLEMRRYGLVDGTPMHWTRVADLLPAGLIFAFSHIMPQVRAEELTLVVVPGLLLIPYLVVLAWVVQRVTPNHSALRVVLMVGLVAIQIPKQLEPFGPGMLDHHNLQQIAFLTMLGGMCGPRSFHSGLVSACGMVVGLTIGLDSMPALLTLVVTIGLFWVFDPKPELAFVRGFGLGVVALTPLSGLVFIPRPATAQWCDSWTLPLSTIVFGFGLYMLFVAWLSVRVSHNWTRTGIAAVVGGITLGALLWLNPACLNPLPLPKDNVLVDRYWWSNIGEVRSIWQDFRYNPKTAVVHFVGLFGIAAFALTIWRRPEYFRASGPLVMACVGTFAFAAQHQRGQAIFAAVLVPLFASMLLQALTLLQSKRPLFRALIALSPGLMWASGTAALAKTADLLNHAPTHEPLRTDTASWPLAQAPKTSERIVQCFGEAELRALNALQPSRIFAPFGSNEFLLAVTAHHTLFGGFHRNVDENIEILNALTASEAEAHQWAIARNVEYFDFCASNSQFATIANDYPTSFIAAVVAGRPPNWLIPALPLQNGTIYRVARSEPSSGSMAGAKQ